MTVIALTDAVPPRNIVPIGRTSTAILQLDLDRLLAGRMLIQGSSGAGKSQTLRRIIEEAFDYVTTIIVDPEGDFHNLAEHIGATTLHAAELSAEGLTAAAGRSREHRISLHLDLTDLDPDQRIVKAAAFFAGLIGAPREHWDNTTLVCIDEGHLLAPHVAGSAQDAESRRLGVATLTDLCGRGRKRGIATIIATQRLAKLATSVTSELQNVLIGLNIFDRDIGRAADLLGIARRDGDRLRKLRAGEFYALGPALTDTSVLAKIDPTITRHFGSTPELRAAGTFGDGEAERLLDLGALQEVRGARDGALAMKGQRALDAFLLDPAAATAVLVIDALRRISPNATTAAELARHLGREVDVIHGAADMLSALSAIDAGVRGGDRIMRLHARLRQRAADVPVVSLT